MNRSLLLLVIVCASCAGIAAGACASNESDGPPNTNPPEVVVPTLDAGEGGADASLEAAPCADCEDFPEICTADVLCPNGPFDTANEASNLDPRTDILVVNGRGLNDVWVAGAVGGVARFDGTSWTRSDLGAPETQRALWLQSTGEAAFGTFTNIYTRGLASDAGAVSSGGWSVQTISSAPFTFDPFSQQLRSAWAPAGADTMWMATLGTSGLWRLRFTAPATFDILEGVSPETCANIGCTEIFAIHGVSASSVWAVGGAGGTFHVSQADGETPIATAFNSVTTSALRGVWAASDTDVWSVGATGTIRHYRGDPLLWDVVGNVPTQKSLNAIWGTSASDIWAVGDGGVALHYDGTSWSRVKVAGLGSLRPNLYAVWSPAPGHVWAGGQGVVLSLGGKP